MKTKLIVDHVGHNIIGELVSEDEKTVVLRSPAVLYAQPNQNNQLQVQLFPVLFKEFLSGATKDKGAAFTYLKSRIVETDAELDEKLVQQYKVMFNAQPGGNASAPTSDNEVIKLFDE
jgi:hypothetical protein